MSDIDSGYYRQRYSDLANLTDDQLKRHWQQHGHAEGRFPNAQAEQQWEEREGQYVRALLDIQYYRKQYADLANLTDEQLVEHWLTRGHEEGRLGSSQHLLEHAREVVESEDSSVDQKLDHEAIEARLDRLDTSFYRQHYSDLASKSDQALVAHWLKHGFAEARFGRREELESVDPVEIKSAVWTAEAYLKEYGFDPDFYIAYHDDLEEYDYQAALEHYQAFGRSEKRPASLQQFSRLKLNGEVDFGTNITLEDVYQHNLNNGLDITFKDLTAVLLGEPTYAASFFTARENDVGLYLALAVQRLLAQEYDCARALAATGLVFKQSARLYEVMGNTYLDQERPQLALGFYDAGLEVAENLAYVHANRMRCLASMGRYQSVIDTYIHGIAVVDNPHLLHIQFDEWVKEHWGNQQDSLLRWVDRGDRQQLVESSWTNTKALYYAYWARYTPGREGGETRYSAMDDDLPDLPTLGSINARKVLIVGDFHVPQCVRYRIDQKVEQLEAQDRQVEVIDWTELEEYHNQVVLHDLVIFYRVPAVPDVVRAMAQVNVTGKLSLYEIDDLILDPVYPPALESYGGYVSPQTYRRLTQGMAMFNSAARLCRLGLASSEPLRDYMASLVQDKRCLLHRNGLDKLNLFREIDKSAKTTIDIFYGSGTQAHNSDFIEQALPAIERILEEVPEARLVVVGYLKLPVAFRERFAEQLSQLPAVKHVQGYWSLLEQADINIAVLHDDAINSCKSELKWFEAACFGIPSIVSSTANYRDVIHDGEDAFLATSVEEWYQALKQLTDSAEARHRVGRTAMERIRGEYSVGELGRQLVEQLDREASKGETNKPKVALVNVFFPPQSIGGATRVVADNFSALCQNYSEELDVCVFTADAEHGPPHEMTAYEWQGKRVYRASTLWREHMDWYPNDDEMYTLFQEFLELENPDVVHFHSVQRLTASIVQAAKDTGVPYMITAHDAWWISDFQFLVDENGKVYPEGHPDPYASIEMPKGISLGSSIQRRRDLKELLAGAAQVLTVSETFANIYRRNGVSNIKVIPNGISDDMAWAPKDTSHIERLICGHVGNMTNHKGYYLLKDAVLETQPQHLEFLIVDHSKDESYVHQSYWGEVPVTFIGRMAQDRVVEIYRRMDVLFAPSTWPESFGLVTREAAACGCWVVASNLGGIGEDVIEGETGHVITPNSEQMESMLNKLDQNHEKYKKETLTEDLMTSSKQTAQLKGEYLKQC
ncbi:glycosyltransferase [Halomonas halmophila]|nr:glycosyltransferase [Halomonas halmophila]